MVKIKLMTVTGLHDIEQRSDHCKIEITNRYLLYLAISYKGAWPKIPQTTILSLNPKSEWRVYLKILVRSQ